MSSGSRACRRAHGFTYVAVLFLIAASGAALAATATVWSHERQREKEGELLWIGEQFRQAIAHYYLRTPGAVKRYPEKLEDLLEDKRYLNTQRYLRKIYRDPTTGKAEWGLVAAPDGGVMGVHSLSEEPAIKTAESPNRVQGDSGIARRYTDWRFVFEPPPVVSNAESSRK